MGHIECCLDEEGVVYVDAREYAASRLAPETLDLMELVFAWGDDQADVVSKFRPSVSDRVRVTGNPRVDLWRPEFRSIYEARAVELRERWGPFVLVASSFAMVNHARGDGMYLEVVAQNRMLDSAESASQVRGQISHWTKIFDALRPAIADVGRSLPGHRIVVRPHPSESSEAWQRIADTVPNVVVVKEGEITPWLLAADVVVHSNCTSGVEAVLLGRPTIAFAPYEDPRYDQNIPNAVSQRARTAAELVDLVAENIGVGGLPASEYATDVIESHVAGLAGRFAADRIVDQLERLDLPELPFTATRWRKIRTALSLTPLRLGRVAQGLRRSRSSTVVTDSNSAPNTKFEGSSLAEVEDFVAMLREASSRFGDVRCFEVDRDVYAIVSEAAA